MAPQKDTQGKTPLKKGQKQNLVIHNIVIKQPQRKSVDVNEWRQALITAESQSGKRVKLYDLYEDVMLDPVLSDAVDKRIMAVTNSNIVFQRDGNPVPELDDLIDSDEFELLLTEMMLSKFWGITLLEMDFSAGFACASIPRKHINPRTGMILINQADDKGIPYREDPFFLEIGSKSNLGLILKVAPYVIYKRGGFGDLAQFAEIFGQPFTEGTYDAYDDYGRKQLENAFENRGGAQWILHPKGSEIKLIESKANGSGGVYKTLNEACDEQILIGILGQTMTTKNGSSKSQSETHQDEQSDLNKADRRFIQRILNHRFLPKLEARGFPVTGGWFSFPESGEKVPLKDRIDIDGKLMEMIPIDDQYFYDTYGVPKPSGVQLKKKESEPEGEVPEKKPPIKASRISALKDLFSFFLNPPAGHIRSAGGQTPAITAALSINTNQIIEQIAQRMLDGKIPNDQIDPDLALASGDFLMNALKDNFDALDEIASDDQAKVNWINRQQNNIYKFGMAKAYSQMKEMRDSILGPEGKIKPFTEFLKDAMLIDDKYNKTWLETEHNAVVRGTVMGTQWMDIEEQKEVAPFLQYITAGDERVRESHRSLDGIIEPVDSSFWNQYYPPNGWNCRCSVKQLSDRHTNHEGYTPGKTDSNSKMAGEMVADKYWRKNTGKSAILEADKTAYIKAVPSKGNKQLKAVANYGMKSAEDIMAKASTQKVERLSKGEFENWWKLQQDNKGNIEIKDYNKIPLQFDEEFKKHVINNNHYDIASELIKIGKNPDEVWAQTKSSIHFKEDYFKVYTKYYKEKTVALMVDKNGRPITMYEADNIEDLRKGILLKKK